LPGAAGLAKAAGPVLKLKFEGDAWVEIRDKSGKKIFSELSRAGSEKTVQGVPPLSLVVGDAAKVRITYNGKPLDLAPHVKKTVARLTLE
jgi:cytoskeleton protein RodZ